MSFANVLKTLQGLLADNAITILLLVLACALVMWYCKCTQENLTDFEQVAKKYIDIDKSLIDARRNHYQIFGKELKDTR